MGATSVGSPPSIRLDVLSVGLSARQSLSLGFGVLTPYYRQLTKLRPWPCLSMQVMVFILHCANWEWDGYGHGWTLFGKRGPCEIVFRESAVCTCNNAGSVVSSYADHGFDSLQTETPKVVPLATVYFPHGVVTAGGYDGIMEDNTPPLKVLHELTPERTAAQSMATVHQYFRTS
ncbi:hypothetical protein AXG93_4804s1120 [Marchantia polymorpha subsp. ruderalis]|uniref:Uncharacterized protein n=1 Tax=Marchantia polymorpha subsp. ruderalis TaxID=1480154 RepID=A0A176VN18_MARPO|nr:hypothetical protein AXG93_4804s1120 [Marchantia polymorpha subsp. ruderalis]